MKKIPLYVALARTIAWQPPEGTEWVEKKEERLKALLDELPSGSGWDNGTKLGTSTGERIVLFGSFHHMDENGFYCGWTDHEVHVTPSLRFGFDLRITGRDRNEIKDYLHDLFHEALSMPVWEYDYEMHGGFVVEDRDGEPVEVAFSDLTGIWDAYAYDPTVRRLYSTHGV